MLITKTRRNIIKIFAGALAATTAGITNAVLPKRYAVQPILQDILQTQTMGGPVGLSFLLRYKEGKLPTDPLNLVMEKAPIETIRIKNFIEFDRNEFRKILKAVANKKSHELTSLIIIGNRVAIDSRRGAANIFVVHPQEQEYVEQYFKQMEVTHCRVLIHPDVPKNYVLAVYKGKEAWDGAGVFCPMKGNEKNRAGVWTHDLDKFMYLGRFK